MPSAGIRACTPPPNHYPSASSQDHQETYHKEESKKLVEVSPSPTPSPTKSDGSSEISDCDSDMSDHRIRRRDSENMSDDSEASTLSLPPVIQQQHPADDPNELFSYVMTADIVRHSLLQRLNYNWRECPQLPEPNRYRLVMRDQAEKFASRYPDRMQQLIRTLQIDRATAAPQFAKVCDGLIKDGQVGWGRVIAFFAFTGELAVYCVQNGMHNIVPSIPQWAGFFLQSRLKPWIVKNGGWDGLIDFHENGDRGVYYRNLGGYACCAATVVGILALSLKFGMPRYHAPS